jgi:hypothetical protein
MPWELSFPSNNFMLYFLRLCPQTIKIRICFFLTCCTIAAGAFCFCLQHVHGQMFLWKVQAEHCQSILLLRHFDSCVENRMPKNNVTLGNFTQESWTDVIIKIQA